jgi:membrane fusion protein, multidrug efflux system
MKSVSTILFLLLLGTSLLFLGCSSGSESDASGEEAATAIAGYELQPRDMSRIVRASSQVEPENVITIAGRMSGLITTMQVREGDRLNQGEVMLRFDVEEQAAELDRARAELELASAVYDRNQTLFEREAISTAEYEEARANKKIAESEVKLLETRVGFGTVRAPHDLIVLRRYVEQGDAVSANEPLFRAADLNRLVVRVGISERDVVSLEPGQQANLQIDAFPGQTFQGTIQRIYPSADENSRLFTVEITLRAEQKDQVIRPGYLARVSMDADRRENVLAVPSESLLASEQDERFVYIINDENRLERRDVVTGIERRNWTQIQDGLESGDVVVGANPSNLRENILVNVTRWVEDDSPQVAGRR